MDFTKCDGIAIGQASIGRPWIFKQINDYLTTGKYNEFDLKKVKKICLEHIKLFKKYNSDDNFFELKKNIPHYFKGMKNRKAFNVKIFKTDSYKDLINIIDKL